jgi:hypothetical protein
VLRPTRRRFGYLVWGAAFVTTIVPELLAAWHVTERHLPFPTISRTIGHLEVVNPVWEVLPTLLIVLFVYALLRAPLPGTAAGPPADDEVPDEYRAFLVRAALCAVLLIAVGVCAPLVWPDQHLATDDHKLPNFYVAYCFWGTTFVVWAALPTVTAVLGRRHKFPSLTNTIVNFEQWLAAFGRVGRGAAWTVGFVLVWGMAFLLLHLTLYPFPDITRQLNRSEIVCGRGAHAAIVSRLPRDRDASCHVGGYPPGNGG